jgi:magnesium transporter
MLNLYALEKGRLSPVPLDQATSRSLVWVDAVSPGDDERTWIKQTFSVELPQAEHLRDIESSARFYEENQQYHVRSDFLSGKGIDSHSVIVAFVLSNNVLFSVHDEDLPLFQSFRQRASSHPEEIANCLDVLIDLYESDIEYSADTLEDVYAELGNVSSIALHNSLDRKSVV